MFCICIHCKERVWNPKSLPTLCRVACFCYTTLVHTSPLKQITAIILDSNIQASCYSKIPWGNEKTHNIKLISISDQGAVLCNWVNTFLVRTALTIVWSRLMNWTLANPAGSKACLAVGVKPEGEMHYRSVTSHAPIYFSAILAALLLENENVKIQQSD